MYFVVYKKHVSISSCYRSADQQAAKTEEQQFMSGPLSLLYNAVKSNYQVFQTLSSPFSSSYSDPLLPL